MKAGIIYTSNYGVDPVETLEINTIEELLKFQASKKEYLVIIPGDYAGFGGDIDFTIEVYDTYRE